jgi:hypothetical protein
MLHLPHILLAPSWDLSFWGFLLGGVELWLFLLLLPFMVVIGIVGAFADRNKANR